MRNLQENKTEIGKGAGLLATKTNGLEKITEKILSEARESARKIIEAAQEECDRIIADDRSRAEEIRAAGERDAGQRAADILSRAQSSAAMQERNVIGRKKSDLIESVFQNVYESVGKRSRKDYTALVVGLLASALTELAETEEKNFALYGEEDESSAEPYEVILNAKDRETIGSAVIAGVKKTLKGVLSEARSEKIVLAQTTAEIDGGVILRYGDVESNCSIGMLFSQLRRELETDVGRALFADHAL